MTFRRLTAAVRRFFAAAPDAIEGYLNVEELVRVSIAAIGAGATTFELLEVVATTPTVYADQALGAVLVAAITAGLDAYRRFGHETIGRPVG